MWAIYRTARTSETWLLCSISILCDSQSDGTRIPSLNAARPSTHPLPPVCPPPPCFSAHIFTSSSSSSTTTVVAATACSLTNENVCGCLHHFHFHDEFPVLLFCSAIILLFARNSAPPLPPSPPPPPPPPPPVA